MTQKTGTSSSARGLRLWKSENKRAQAFWLLLLGVFFWSLMPLAVAVSGAGDRPFLFAAIFGLFSAIGLILYLLFFERKHLKTEKTGLWREFIQRLRPKSDSSASGNHFARHDYTSNDQSDGPQPEKLSFWDRKVLWLTFIGRFEVLLFAWSTQFVDTAVATIIYELWVIWFVLFRSKSVKRASNGSAEKENKASIQGVPQASIGTENSESPEDDEESKVSSKSWIYLVLAVIGLLFVNISQNGTVLSLAYQGLILALASSLFAALQIERPLRYGEMVAEKNIKLGNETVENSNLSFDKNTDTSEEERETNEKRKNRIALVHTLFVIIITTLVSSAINAVIFLIRLFNDSSRFDYTGSQMIWIIASGMIIGSLVFVFNRKGNGLAKETPDLNAIAYATPVLAIIWLLAWNRIEIARFDMFIIGAVLIVAVNLLINFKADLNRVGFQWLVVSIWIAGVATYFRDWIGSQSNISWLWEHEIVDYYTMVALSVTVFTLILSFRTSRLVERTRYEEELAFSLYRQLEDLSEGEVSDSVKKSVKKIDKWHSKSKLSELQSNHRNIYNAIGRIDKSLLTVAEKAKLRSDLDFLALSKTRSRDLSEPTVLIIFSFIAVSLTLFTRPIVSQEAEKWVGFLLESFSVLFSATIIFLTVNLFDIMSERKVSNFEMFHPKTDQNHKDKSLQDEAKTTGLITSYAWQRRISTFLLLGMIALFGLLLWSKWLGLDWLVEADLIPVS